MPSSPITPSHRPSTPNPNPLTPLIPSLTDINAELRYYRPCFRHQSIFCDSVFAPYFTANFKSLHLSELHILNSLTDVYKHDYLPESSITICFPALNSLPYYLPILSNHRFIALGTLSYTRYGEIFPLFMSDSIRLGYNHGSYWFAASKSANAMSGFNSEEKSATPKRIGNICWYTNLPVSRHNRPISLTAHYSPSLYPTYDTYDAINVDRISDIPCDYSGTIGVPLTYLIVHNPDQFTILGLLSNAKSHKYVLGKAILNGEPINPRILIRKL